MGTAAIADAPVVDLVEVGALEVELAASLLYPHCHYSYRQVLEVVGGLSAARLAEIVELGGAASRAA